MGGGREASEEAAAMVQADGCGLDGLRNGQILEIFLELEPRGLG